MPTRHWLEIPRPANRNERPIGNEKNLTPAQKVLLQGIRYNIEFIIGKRDDLRELIVAYDRYGIRPAAFKLNSFLRVVTIAAQQPVSSYFFSSQNVSNDEQAILEAVALLQLGDADAAGDVLEELIPPSVTPFALNEASSIAFSFRMRGLWCA